MTWVFQQTKPPDEPGTFTHKIQQMFVEHLLLSHCRLGTVDTGLNKVKFSALLDFIPWQGKIQNEEDIV